MQEDDDAVVAGDGKCGRDDGRQAGRVNRVDLAVASAPAIVRLRQIAREVGAVVAVRCGCSRSKIVIVQQALRDDQIVRLVAARHRRRHRPRRSGDRSRTRGSRHEHGAMRARDERSSRAHRGTRRRRRRAPAPDPTASHTTSDRWPDQISNAAGSDDDSHGKSSSAEQRHRSAATRRASHADPHAGRLRGSRRSRHRTTPADSAQTRRARQPVSASVPCDNHAASAVARERARERQA